MTVGQKKTAKATLEVKGGGVSVLGIGDKDMPEY